MWWLEDFLWVRLDPEEVVTVYRSYLSLGGFGIMDLAGIVRNASLVLCGNMNEMNPSAAGVGSISFTDMGINENLHHQSATLVVLAASTA